MEVAHKVSVLVNSGPVFDFGAWQRVNVAGEKSDNLYKSGSYDGFNLLYGFGGGLQYSFLLIEVGAEFGLLSKHDLTALRLPRGTNRFTLPFHLCSNSDIPQMFRRGVVAFRNALIEAAWYCSLCCGEVLIFGGSLGCFVAKTEKK